MHFSLSKLSSLLIAGVITSTLCLSPLTEATPMASDNDKMSKAEKKVKEKSKAAGKLKESNNKKVKKAKNKGDSKIRVNINTASEAELMMLKGIGKNKAKAIVNYRQKNGQFKTADDLLNVKGIGKKLVSKNSARISLSGKSTIPAKDLVKRKKSKDKAMDKAESTRKNKTNVKSK